LGPIRPCLVAQNAIFPTGQHFAFYRAIRPAI
jgi:hypothetical protein